MDTPSKKLRTLLLPKPQRGRVEFRPEEFRRLVLTRNTDVLWQQRANCPCSLKMVFGLDETTGGGKPNPKCPECFGQGLIYHSGRIIPVGMTSATKLNYQKIGFSEYEEGTAAFTVLPEHTMGPLDRITLVNNSMTYHESKIRQDVVEKFRWPIYRRPVSVGDEYNPVIPERLSISVLYLRIASPDGELLPHIPVENEDFTIVDNAIDWTLGDERGTAPVPGAGYTVQYIGRQVYFVMNELPYANRDVRVALKRKYPTFVEMPRLVRGKLAYLGDPRNVPTFPSYDDVDGDGYYNGQ